MGARWRRTARTQTDSRQWQGSRRDHLRPPRDLHSGARSRSSVDRYCRSARICPGCGRPPQSGRMKYLIADVKVRMTRPSSHLHIAAGTLGLLLGACAHHPASPPPALSAAPGVRAWTDPALIGTLSTLRAEPAAPDTLTSTEALAAALTYNPELALQRAQGEIARAELAQARQHRNPILNLTPEHLVSAAANGISPWVVALSLVWPLRTAGKRELEIEQALASSDASLLDGANTVWTLRAAVRGAVCALELATERNQLALDESSLRADLATRLGRQADAGIASRYDAARAQIESDQALQRAREGAATLESARFDLSDVTGLPRSALDGRQVGSTCS